LVRCSGTAVSAAGGEVIAAVGGHYTVGRTSPGCALPGGRSVAKILVADDNSNIQKMVGLALKDHGIEVVAVGNGEAAVRKISDIKPDLVLADVFMPVRNGYEVCKYVKEDSALAHIPVILLVGAFDPLDEQEAQRVGADGVLKKPFVPPDPLISMVKAALVRAGIAHAGFTPVSAQPPVAEVAPPEPTAKAPAPKALPQEEFPESESFVDELPAPVAALKIDSGSQPLAFGSLLETPGTKTEDDPNATTVSAGPQRDWRAIDEAAEEEEPAAFKASWRDADNNEDTADEAAQRAGGWRDTAGFGGRGSEEKTWTPTREKQDLTEAAGIQETMTATLTATKEPPPVAPFAGDAWAAAISAGSHEKTAVAETERPVEETREQETPVFHGVAPVVTEESTPREPEPSPYSSPAVAAIETPAIETPRKEAPSVEAPAVEAEKSSTASSWFSTPPNPWDTEAKKASQLASTWDSPKAPTVSEPSEPVSAPAASSYESAAAPDEIEVVSEAEVSAVIPAAAVETLREEASHAVEQAVEQVTQETDTRGTPAEVKEATQDALAHLDMDAVVAKVLARMSPDMLQELTREILKPVVETIVREEMNSKKH
jgi:CheY-like chemotaxis protein